MAEARRIHLPYDRAARERFGAFASLNFPDPAVVRVALFERACRAQEATGA